MGDHDLNSRARQNADGRFVDIVVLAAVLLFG
jgi:hypothetical protein